MNLKYLLLCYNVLSFSFIQTETFESKNTSKNELADVTQWEQLKKTDSDTMNAVVTKCEEILSTTRSQCETDIKRLQQILPQITTPSNLKSDVQDTITKIALEMRNTSRQIDQLLEDLEENFLRRLQTIIGTVQLVNPDIAIDFQEVFKSKIKKTDKLAIAIRHFVAEDYNPLKTILSVMKMSLNYKTDDVDEFQQIVRHELKLLLAQMNLEFDQLEDTVIGVLNRISKGMTILKVVYASLKKNGHLPEIWDQSYIKEILQLSTIMSKTAIIDDEEISALSLDIEGQQVSQPTVEQAFDVRISTIRMDVEYSSEQGVDKEEDDSGCGLIFNKTKRKMLKELALAITKIKSLQSIKEIDSQVSEILQDYRMALYELHSTLVLKIVHYSCDFIKLYKLHLDIVDVINPKIKLQMETIFDDTNVDYNHPFYTDIQKYLSSNFLISDKITELWYQIEGSTQGAKTLIEIQKKISQELIAVTNELGRDLENMRMVIIYILKEMNEGILALKSIKENANITGYRYYINYYDGSNDLNQLKELIMILNMLDINRRFDTELAEIISNNQINISRSITHMFLNEIEEDSKQFDEEVSKSINIVSMKNTITKYVTNFNQMIQHYSYKVRKILKQTVTTFITIYKEFIILVNRRRIENMEELERVPDISDQEAEIRFIRDYLAENMQINVEEQYGTSFNINTSNINEFKTDVKQQIHRLTQTMTSELSQLDLQIKNVIDKIIQEAQKIQVMKQDLIVNRNFKIHMEQLSNLGLILNLYDFLQVLPNQNNINEKSFNQELYKIFNKTRMQIQSAKTNAQQVLQESTEISNLKMHIVETSCSIHLILQDFGRQLKVNLAEISLNFEKAFKMFIGEELKNQILNVEIQMQPLSEQLKKYLTNRYANTILNPFNQILSHSSYNLDTVKSKDMVLASLNEGIEKIEKDMDLIIKETSNVVKKLSRGIKLMENFRNRDDLLITDDEANLLSVGNNLVTILQNLFSSDSIYTADEMQNAINLAHEIATQEYDQIKTNILTMNSESDINTKLSNYMQTIAETYTSLTTDIRSQLQTFASTFTEIYVNAMGNILGKNDKLEFIMQDIMNGQIASMQNTKHKNAITFMKSDAFSAASEWVRSLFQLVKQDATIQFVNETTVQQLGSFHSHIDNALKNMQETVTIMIEDFKRSSVIIQTVINNNELNLNEEQINSLSNSFQLIQMLTRESKTVSSNRDFNNAKQLIVEEYQNTVTEIERIDDDTIIHDITVRTIDSFTSIYNNLRSVIGELFIQKISEFLASYNSIKEMAEHTGNVDLKNMLDEVTNNKEILQTSQQLQEVETFVNSEKFTSSTIVQQLYENQSQILDIEKLSTVKKEVESYIYEMEKVCTFIQEKSEAASQFLTSAENSSIIQWSNEQITTVAETITIAEKLLPKDRAEILSNSESLESNSGVKSDNLETQNAKVRSLSETENTETNINTTSNIFVEAQNSILTEFDNAQALIETATDEMSIQQTMNISIERYGSIFNNLKNQFKNNINNSWERYENLMLDVRNIVESNQLRLKLQDIVENKKYSTTFTDVDFARFAAIITSDIYRSENIVNAMYEEMHNNSNIQLKINEISLNKLRWITKNINENIVEIEFSETYIQQKFEQGSIILNEISSGNIDQLSQEQIKILALNAQIGQLLKATTGTSTEILSMVFPAVEESINTDLVTDTSTEIISEDCNKAKSEINEIYKKTKWEIESLVDEKAIEQAALESVYSNENIYNGLKKLAQDQITKHSTKFQETMKITLTTVENSGNEETANILRNLSHHEIKTDRDFNKFKTFKNSDSYNSDIYAENLYQEMQNNVSQSNISIQEKQLEHLRLINTILNEDIDNLNEISNYTVKNINKSLEILETINSDSQTSLTEEQIQCLAVSNAMTIPSLMPQIINEENKTLMPLKPSVTNEEDNGGNIFDESEINLIQTKKTIRDKYLKTVELLKTLRTEEIQSVMNDFVENCNALYNNIRENIHNKMVENSQYMLHCYENSMNYEEGRENIQKVMRDMNFEATTDYAEFETFIISSYFTSTEAIKEIFEGIQEENTAEVKENSVTEWNIQKLEALNMKIEEYIDKMANMDAYVNINFKKISKILSQIEKKEIIELTEEQIQILALGQKIIHSLILRDKINISTTNEFLTENNNQIITNLIDSPIMETEKQTNVLAEAVVTETNLPTVETKPQAEIPVITDTIQNENVINQSTELEDEEVVTEMGLPAVDIKPQDEELVITNTITNQEAEIMNKRIKKLEDKEGVEDETRFIAVGTKPQVETPVVTDIIQNQEAEIMNQIIELKDEEAIRTETSLPAIQNKPQVEISAIADIIQNQKEKAINQIRELEDEDSIKYVVVDTMHNFDLALNEVQQNIDQKIGECTERYEQNYQLAIDLIEESDTEQYECIFEEQLNFLPDDQFEKFEKYIRNGGLQLPTAESILNDVEQNGELFTHDINEQYAVELDIISTQIKQNMFELEEITSYATTNLENGSATLDLIVAADTNVELSEQQIQDLALSHHIMQVLEIVTMDKEQNHSSRVIPEKKDQEEQSRHEDNASRCITTNNVTSIKGKIRNFDSISVTELLVADTNSSVYQNLSWNINNFTPQDQRAIEEIREYLLAAQNTVTAIFRYQQTRINLYQNSNDILVIFVNTTELIDEILQQLSSVILKRIVQLIEPILKKIKNSVFQQELENTSRSLDAKFLNSFEIFSSLSLYERTDILDFVDEQFVNAQCTSLAISKEIILQKFSVLNEIIEKILSHIKFIILKTIDLVINAEVALQMNVKNLEVIKNIQLLYDIINQINS